ncbi:MAG: 1-acyl-sn-glycerol-3-phosphate acyltransferase [Pirellulales bacterium]
MNRYPMVFAPCSWSPQLSPRIVSWLKPLRRRRLRNESQLHEVEALGTGHLAEAMRTGKRVLITPNHPSHADPWAIYEACDQVQTTCHIMAAWHVFAKQSWIMRKCLQWHGCFSIDREANDLTAFRDAVAVLRERTEPLVIFPEGDIYHCNDRVTPFREGAAAIAIAAARRLEKEVVILPTAIRYRYLSDPMPHLLETLTRIEQRLLWRPRHNTHVVDRIRAIGEAVLSLKEQEFYGRSSHGSLPERIASLTEFLLNKLEKHYGLEPQDTVPKRVKQLRQTILTRHHDQRTPVEQIGMMREHLDEAFLVLQLFSYPGDYLEGTEPSIERIAETVDKLEEDVLQIKTATVRSSRRAVVHFGEPIAVPTSKSRDVTASLIQCVEARVRELIEGRAERNTVSPIAG